MVAGGASVAASAAARRALPAGHCTVRPWAAGGRGSSFCPLRRAEPSEASTAKVPPRGIYDFPGDCAPFRDSEQPNEPRWC